MNGVAVGAQKPENLILEIIFEKSKFYREVVCY